MTMEWSDSVEQNNFFLLNYFNETSKLCMEVLENVQPDIHVRYRRLPWGACGGGGGGGS